MSAGAVDATWATAERLAAVVVAGMIREAAYQGEQVSASEIAHCFVNDPMGETASYARRSAAGAVDWYFKLKADPELLAVFPGLAMSEQTKAGAVGRRPLEDEIVEALNASESGKHLAAKFIALMEAADALRQAAGRGSNALSSAIAWYLPEGEDMGRAPAIRRSWETLDSALATFDAQGWAMSEPTVDVFRNLHMAYQHIVICGPDETVQAALIAVEDAVAELIEADRAYDEAWAAMLTDQSTACGERFSAAKKRRAAALARISGASP